MLASAVVIGLALGLLARGDLWRVAHLRPRWLPLFSVALVLRIASVTAPGDDFQRLSYALSLWALALVSVANLTLPGARLIAAGIALNSIVVTANGGAMPVASDSVAAAGRNIPLDRLHLIADADTPLSWLGDIFPVSLLRSVYSIGDVILAGGVVILIFKTMTRR